MAECALIGVYFISTTTKCNAAGASQSDSVGI